MKAVVLKKTGGYENLVIEDNRAVPEPEVDEVRVKVTAVGLNPVDYKLIHGWGSVKWQEQPVLGLDVAGIVDNLGNHAEGFSVGERVYYHGNLSKVNGGFAEYACTTAHTVSKIAENVGAITAAAIPCAGFTAYQAVIDKIKLEKGATILIHGGAGGVGGFAIQLAKLKGAQVFTTCSPSNDQYVKQLGADYIIHYKQVDVCEEVLKLTGGRGVDYVIDTVGQESATHSIDMLAFSGQLVAVVEHPDFKRLTFYEKGISIHEVALGGAHLNGDIRAQKRLAQIGDCYMKLLTSEAIQSPKIQTVGIEEIPDYLAKMEAGHVSGKIVAVIDHAQ